jgi:hypothetical protein
VSVGIYLEETAEGAVVNTLALHLADEMVALQRAKDDGLDLVIPSAGDIRDYAQWKTTLLRGVQIEIFSDASAPITTAEAAELGAGVLTTEAIVMVRVTIKDGGNEGPFKLKQRVQRTCAAVVRVCARRYWDLDNAVESCRWLGNQARNLAGDKLVRQQTVRLAVRVREALT